MFLRNYCLIHAGKYIKMLTINGLFFQSSIEILFIALYISNKFLKLFLGLLTKCLVYLNFPLLHIADVEFIFLCRRKMLQEQSVLYKAFVGTQCLLGHF